MWFTIRMCRRRRRTEEEKKWELSDPANSIEFLSNFNLRLHSRKSRTDDNFFSNYYSVLLSFRVTATDNLSQKRLFFSWMKTINGRKKSSKYESANECEQRKWQQKEDGEKHTIFFFCLFHSACFRAFSIIFISVKWNSHTWSLNMLLKAM